MQQAIETDAIIIGAGPVGLFQVFELGLLEIKAHVIDSLPVAGGQCVELYPDKPIYDIPAIPVCTGQELTNNLLKQIEPFGAQFHLGQEVISLERQVDGRLKLNTSLDKEFISKVVFIAAGVGAFQPRTLRLDGIEAFEGKQLFYSIKDPERFREKRILICGGGDSALDWALHFVGKAKSVVLIHRRDDFKAAPKSIAKMRQLCASHEMELLIGQPTAYETIDDRLTEIKVTDIDGNTRQVPVDDVLVFFWPIP